MIVEGRENDDAQRLETLAEYLEGGEAVDAGQCKIEEEQVEGTILIEQRVGGHEVGAIAHDDLFL